MHDPRPGFHKEDFLGKRMDEVLPFDSAQVIVNIHKKVFETAQAQRGQVMVDIDGKPVYYNYYAKPITDDTGSVVELACAAYDITEQKKTEQALTRYSKRIWRKLWPNERTTLKKPQILQTMLDAIRDTYFWIRTDGLLLVNQTLANSLKRPLDRFNS